MERIQINNKIPLLGALQFGLVDRGSNLVQIRPTSLCNLNCPFCSTDAGVKSKTHNVYYEVELEHLLNWIKKVIDLKGNILANIDSVGEIFTYPEIYDLIKRLKNMNGINEISMQTNGVLMDFDNTKTHESKRDSVPQNFKKVFRESKIFGATKQGFEGVKDYVDRINLSINSLDKEKARELSGCKSYDIGKIVNLAEKISKSNVELLIAPIWIPNVNDSDIIDIIKFCKKLKCKIGIQKYEIYKYGRKIKQAKKINWFKFYEQLEKWEKEFDIKLKLGPRDFKVEKRKRFPKIFEKNDKVNVEIVCKGWYKGQMIGIAKNRCITINDCDKKISDRVNIKILENKNNIYLAEMI